MPKSDPFERALEQPPADMLSVQNYYAIAGRPYADIWDPETGQTWIGVPVLCAGGGQAAYAHMPVQPEASYLPTDAMTKLSEASQVYGVYRGVDRRPVAVAALHHPAVKMLPEPLLGPSSADDLARPSIREPHLRFGGTTIMVREGGGVVIDLAAEAGLSIQLGGAGAIRMSSDGEAGERFVLAGELITYLQTLVAAINEIGTALSELTVELATAAGSPVPPVDPILPATSVSDPTVSIKSALVHASSKTEADGL